MQGEAARAQQTLDASTSELRRAVAALVQALRDEHAALAAGEIEAVDRCGARKSVCLATVESLLAEQHHLGRAFDTPRRLIAGDAELQRQLRIARDQNEANGLLVQTRMQFLGMALAALGATACGPIYGRDGRTHTRYDAPTARARHA